MQTKAIIFDIDGTLTPQNSWTAFTADMGASVEDHLSIYRSHLDGDNDIKLFELTRNGILITGSKHKPELSKAAWQTVDSLDEIQALLSSLN